LGSRYSLGTKFNILLAAVFLVGMGVTWGVVSWIARHQAQDEVASKAEILLQAMNGVRQYTNDDVDRFLKGVQESRNTFLPETVPAFSARQVFERFRAAGYGQFFYKEASRNPTNVKDDKSDTFEDGVLAAFTQESSLKTLSGYREDFGGERRFYTAVPLRLTDASCLRCHDTPEAAPPALVSVYGRNNGFGWKLGDVIATRIVYVPAGKVSGIAQRSALLVTGLYALVFGAGIAAINLLLRRGVLQPINSLAAATDVMSGGKGHSHDSTFTQSTAAAELEKSKARGDEIGELSGRFLLMAGEVEKREQGMRLAQSQAQAREAYFRALIENASVAYLILDDRYAVRYASPLVNKVLGAEPAAIVGKMMLHLVGPEQQRALYDSIEKAEKKEGTSEPFVFERRVEGAERYIEAVVTNLLQQPSIKGLVVVMRDVTERKKLEAMEKGGGAAAEGVREVVEVKRVEQRGVEESALAIADRLMVLFPNLPVEQQQGIAMRLMAAGIAGTASAQSGGANLPVSSVAMLRTKLMMPATEAVDAGRLMELTAMLADFAVGLDTLVWGTWRTMAPQSELRRSGGSTATSAAGLRKTCGSYVGAEGTTPRGEVAHELERTRALLAALIASLGHVAQEFARTYREKFSPLEVEKRAGGGLMKDAKCWRAYKEMANEMSPEKMEAEVLRGLAAYAEGLMKGK
jgi:PAS domain S-box-containing protein